MYNSFVESGGIHMKIPGIDVLEGLEHSGNDEDLYIEILHIYFEDGEEMLNELRKGLQHTDMKLFITHTHAMKSSSRNIGAIEVSEMFKEMEFAGKDNNMDLIESKLPVCLDALEKLLADLNNYFENGDSEDSGDAPDVLIIKKLQAALDDMDTDTFDELFEELQSKPYNEAVKGILTQIQVAYDDFDFSTVNDLLEELL